MRKSWDSRGLQPQLRLASRKFQTAIDEIDTIKHLQKVKDNLISSENNLRLANDRPRAQHPQAYLGQQNHEGEVPRGSRGGGARCPRTSPSGASSAGDLADSEV
ncbi:MAG: hypothetical protein ACLTKG_06475 [Collinsella intestinalis]